MKNLAAHLGDAVETNVVSGTRFSFITKHKLHEEQTHFQHIAIYETEYFGNVMLVDGCFEVTTRDNFIYHEMLVHPALFTHANPENVAIIGCGSCGALREVLKHRGVKSVYQVEIDERVTRLAEQYFPELCDSNDDQRVTFCFEDGVKWIRGIEPSSLDVIIVDSTERSGAVTGLLTEAFYHDCKVALRPDGILVQQSGSPLIHRENIIKNMRRSLDNAGFPSIKTVYFPQPCRPLGWWTCTMAGFGDTVSGECRQHIEKKDFKTVYYNSAIHNSAMTDPQFMLEVLLSDKYSVS